MTRPAAIHECGFGGQCQRGVLVLHLRRCAQRGTVRRVAAKDDEVPKELGASGARQSAGAQEGQCARIRCRHGRKADPALPAWRCPRSAWMRPPTSRHSSSSRSCTASRRPTDPCIPAITACRSGLVADPPDMVLERGELMHDNVPDHIELHAEVAVNQLVTGSRYVAPPNHRFARFQFATEVPDRLTDNFELPNDRTLDHLVTEEHGATAGGESLDQRDRRRMCSR